MNIVKSIINFIKKFRRKSPLEEKKNIKTGTAPLLGFEEKEEKVEKPKEKKICNILSFDGGGIKTLTGVIVLERIEKIIREEFGKELQDYFQVFAGTSAGGLNALMLAGKPKLEAKDLVNFIILKSKLIFLAEKKHFYKIITNKYSKEGLRELLRQEFGNLKIKDSPRNVLVMSLDTISLEPVEISNISDFKNLSFVEAGLATTAAPTYYNPERIELKDKAYNLVDGGLCANNPVLFAYKTAKRIYPDYDEYRIISIAAYKTPDSFDKTDGAFAWVDVTKGNGLPIQKVYHVAQEETASIMIKEFDKVKCLRIQNKRLDFDDRFRVDSLDEREMIRLREIGKIIADENEEKVREFLKNI